MGKLKSLLLALFMAGGLIVALPTAAAAYDPFAAACSSGGSGSTVCRDTGGSDNPLVGDDGIIMKIVDIIAIVTGAVTVILIIIAGLRFVTSGGNSDKVAKARSTITYAVIGLIIVALSRTIIAFIIGKL